MARVLKCLDFDEATQTCVAEAWVEESAWVEMLPTMVEANVVGVAYFGALLIIAFVARTTKPPRYM